MENEFINSLDRIVDSLNRLEVSTKSLTQFTKEIRNLSESYMLLSSASSNLDSTDIMVYLQNFNAVVTTIKNISELEEIIVKFSNVLIPFVSSLGLAEGAVTVLSGALSFLAANPIVAVIGAIGLVVGGLALFNSSNDKVAETTNSASESIENQKHRLDELNESLQGSSKNSKDRITSIMSEYGLLSTCVDKLEEMGKNGDSVKNIEEAKYYIDEINKVLPNSVELTESNKIQWNKSADAIRENIDLIKEKAMIDQQMAKSQEIFAKELEIKREFSQAQQQYNSSLKEYATMKEREGQLSEQEKIRFQELSENLPSLKENYDKASYSMAELNKATDELTLSTEALSGTAVEKGAYMAEAWTTLEENGTVSFSSLGTAFNEFNIKYAELSNSNSQKSKEEAEVYKAASDKIIQTMIEKSVQYGMSYQQMIEAAQANGVKLNNIDYESLYHSYNLYKNSWDERLAEQLKAGGQTVLNEQLMFSDLSELQKGQLSNCLERFTNAGDDTGLSYMVALIGSIRDQKGKVDSQTQKMIDDLEQHARDAKPTINYDANTANADKKIQTTQQKAKFSEIANVAINYLSDFSGISVAGAKLPIYFFADGGFPTTGELFVAREAGPELVGRINGKTAVANNDQIVSGISSGVYNAVRSAMQGHGGNGNMNIHATFVMDGEVVGKQVIKYHNGVVKRTGTTPLMI